MLRYNRPVQRFVFALALMATGGVAVHANPGFDPDSGAARIVTVELERDQQEYRAAYAYCWRPSAYKPGGRVC